MSKITEILKVDIELMIECDCGEVFKWSELKAGKKSKEKDKCWKCGQRYGLVMGPKKIDTPGPKNDDLPRHSKEGSV